MRQFLALLCGLVLLTPVHAEFSARVIGITEGDTIQVLDNSNTQHKIRLAGIDCPERKQPWSTRAKQALSDYVFDQQVTVDWEKRDRYKRIVGKVIQGDGDVNLGLVRDGMCWWYRKYAKEQNALDRVLYAEAEEEARGKRRGLWSDPEPVPPWEWRRR